jgi:hypothetical protein
MLTGAAKTNDGLRIYTARSASGFEEASWFKSDGRGLTSALLVVVFHRDKVGAAMIPGATETSIYVLI